MKEEVFANLKGKTFSDIKVTEDAVIFTVSNSEKYKLYHDQECTETVVLESVTGDIEDIIDSPILLAEEVCNEGVSKADWPVDSKIEPESVQTIYPCDDVYTWTFYKLSTIKGSVTIRFCGTSNGYYSETALLERVKVKKD